MKVELAEKISLIPGRRGGRYPHCNSLLIESGKRAVIDPGSNRKVLRGEADKGVGRVLLSHFHSDHVRDLKELPSSACLVHRIEKEAVEGWEGMVPLVWFPEEERDPTWIRRKDREVGGWGWPVSGTFEDGEEILVGEVEIMVIHTPGHTPGHCCFWFPQSRVLYSADVDLTGFGPWYGNASSDVDDFLDSIEKVRSLDPRITVTGHEIGVVNGSIGKQLDLYASIIEDRHERVLQALDSPRNLDELTRMGLIYGEYFSSSFYDPEYRMVRHHLARAIKQGQAEEKGGFYHLV